jgi:hypothetical protein
MHPHRNVLCRVASRRLLAVFLSMGTPCLVVSDFGRRGRAWCETDVEATDLETIIQDLLDGQYSDPVRVVSFNTGGGSARDISADVAEELRRRCEREMPAGLDAFIERHAGTSPRQFTLRLV